MPTVEKVASADRRPSEADTTAAGGRVLAAPAPSRRRAYPTPILVSGRVAGGLAVAGLALVVLLLRLAPSVPIIALGGAFLALALSFPVRLLSRLMPRGLAILLTFLILLGLITIGLVILLPHLIDQLAGLIGAIPGIGARADTLLRALLQPLAEQNLLPREPEELIASFWQDVFNRVQSLAQRLLASLVGVLSQAFSLAIRLFGICFVAIYLLVDIRKIKAAYLRLTPRRYRRDAQELWERFNASLSRYLGGLIFIMIVQGALTALALWLLGVPYPLLLGAWVSVTAIIPNLGAWLGGIPAIILALLESPVTAILTVLVYVVIQQLESYVLTPRVQGQAIRVHPIIILLAVLAGGELAGLAGVVFAVPSLVVLRVLLDFFRVRIRLAR